MADPSGNGGGSSGADGSNNTSWPPATDVSRYLPDKGDVHATEDTRSRARTQIVSIWSDRLQLASVLATFFTSIDSLLFSLSVNQHNKTNAGELMTSAFSGALVFHAAAAILSYIGAFVLIQFKLTSARNAPTVTQSAPPTFHSPKAVKHPAVHVSGHHPRTTTSSGHAHDKSRPSAHRQSASAPLLSPASPDILTRSTSFVNNLLHSMAFSSSSHIYIEVVHPFSRKKVNTNPETGPDDDDPETNIDALRRLLLRCHRACSIFSLVGFTLLLIGVVAFAWTVLDRAVGIFTSCCVAVSLAIALFALH
ncbi:hypothetical protein PENSPDRAFT_689004 [Peniophora sp. CONT]|nr:hypothetical protein PENSPDRAFT_689004 [Peniophora sp. CONT]